MDRATLLNAKSTISYCPPSLITGQMSVITTYLNDNAQSSLGPFVVYMLYSNFATNTVTNRTDGAWA